MSILKGLQFRRYLCSLLRQNFSSECENALNKQINLELSSSYAYLAMAFHFRNIALNGAYKFFKQASAEETEHAEQMMDYMIKRGGRIVLSDIPAPKNEYGSLLDGMKEALEMEMTVNASLLELHGIATKAEDPNLCDFIESTYLKEQVDVQKQLSDYIKQIELSQLEVGTYIFDVNLAKEGKIH